jgi:hypothetical protein
MDHMNLRKCGICGRLRGRLFDVPRIDIGGGGGILLPDGSMLIDDQLCYCPKGETPWAFNRNIPIRQPYEVYDGNAIPAACMRCFHQECGRCYCEELAIITQTKEILGRLGEKIDGNFLLLHRCEQGKFWSDKKSTMFNGMARGMKALADAYVKSRSPIPQEEDDDED